MVCRGRRPPRGAAALHSSSRTHGTYTGPSGDGPLLRRLLLDLSNAVDEGKVSWAQIQMKVVVSEDVAGGIEQAVRDTGTNPSLRSV